MEAKKLVYTCLISLPCAFVAQNTLGATVGVFVGGGLGYAQIDTPDKDIFLTGSPTPNAIVATVTTLKTENELGGLGGVAYIGYNFTSHFGVEGSYNYYANSEYRSEQQNVDTESPGTNNATVDTKIDFESTSYNVVGKAYYAFNNGFELFARGGAAYVNQKVKYSTDSTSTTSSFAIPVNNAELATPKVGTTTTNRLRPVLGLGAGFNFTPQVGVDFSWSHVFSQGNLKTDTSAIAALDLVTLNLSYTFA